MDTGVGPSLVSKDFFTITGLALSTYSGCEITIADKSKMKIMGTVRLEVMVVIGEQQKTIQQKFLITPTLPFDLILGSKFNSRANFHIDCSTRTVSFSSVGKPSNVPEEKLYLVHSKEDVLIPHHLSLLSSHAVS